MFQSPGDRWVSTSQASTGGGGARPECPGGFNEQHKALNDDPTLQLSATAQLDYPGLREPPASGSFPQLTFPGFWEVSVSSTAQPLAILAFENPLPLGAFHSWQLLAFGSSQPLEPLSPWLSWPSGVPYLWKLPTVGSSWPLGAFSSSRFWTLGHPGLYQALASVGQLCSSSHSKDHLLASLGQWQLLAS
ncbi:hypothetical protein J6590_006285 [Homalodisca vitripennis]|nr:hypothetical protein J6590_006285 [Homalodisca vitripennis]